MATIFLQYAGYVCVVIENSLNCVTACPAFVFLLRCLTHFFCFTFIHTAKLKKSNFANDFFLSLTAFGRVTSFSLSLDKVFRSFA